MQADSFRRHLTEQIIPFWNSLRDEQNGGFCGSVDHALHKDFRSDKGVILHSRILWFYANAYALLGEQRLRDMADHAFRFIKAYCLDAQYGGLFWSVTYDGQPADTVKHTYNQAFGIYALASYADACACQEALDLAMSLYALIESRCRDAGGYLEAFARDFSPTDNDKLSENGVMAGRTMNTLLHVTEAYMELYRVSRDAAVEKSLREALQLFADKIYDQETGSCKVFFDMAYGSLLDLESYGHNIEASWLLDRACAILGDPVVRAQYEPMTERLAEVAYAHAFDPVQGGLNNEREGNAVDRQKIWWVQAESVIGFYNLYQKLSGQQPPATDRQTYLDAAQSVWHFVQEKQVDKRCGEWFESVKADGSIDPAQGLAHEWKCPYHNGRMCIEMVRRLEDSGR
ncbi:MAG: AGE family epimerase/isomerase [Lachnospiraceae bacterium]|nr:AGE family epimerase/isomerase [Lachnospiraceae bacterium]